MNLGFIRLVARDTDHENERCGRGWHHKYPPAFSYAPHAGLLPQGDFFQAECVILDQDEKVDKRHIQRGGDGLYSRMVAYRFTGPGYFTIESLLNMAEDYKREHAKAAARQRQNGGKKAKTQPKLPFRRESYQYSELRRSTRRRA